MRMCLKLSFSLADLDEYYRRLIVKQKTETQTILCDTMCDMNPWEDDVDKCHDDCHPECGV